MLMMRCNPLGLPMAMAGTAMGGMAAMAAVGPFLAGLGVGAALVGGSILARKAMERRNSWRDDDGLGSSTMGTGMSDLGPGSDPTSPTAPPL
jgi:hypothetical protein